MARKRTRSRGVFADKLKVRAVEETQATPEDEGIPGDEHLRVTAYLSVDQLDHLDQDKMRIRRATRRVLERTAIIRALVEGYRNSGVDLAALRIGTESELAELVAERLRAGGS